MCSAEGQVSEGTHEGGNWPRGGDGKGATGLEVGT